MRKPSQPEIEAAHDYCRDAPNGLDERKDADQTDRNVSEAQFPYYYKTFFALKLKYLFGGEGGLGDLFDTCDE